MQIKRDSRLCQPLTNLAKDDTFLLSIKGEWKMPVENPLRQKKRETKKKKENNKNSPGKSRAGAGGVTSKDYDNFPTTNEHENPTTGDSDSQRSNRPGREDSGPLLAAVDED